MYNGVGMLSAKGYESRGCTQTNKFFMKPKKIATKSNGGAAIEGTGGAGGVSEKLRREILEHDRKCSIEIKLVVLKHKLIDHGYTEDEIDEKLIEARKNFEATSLAVSENKGISSWFLSF